MSKNIFFSFFIILVNTSLLTAQKYSNEFMSLGVGAKGQSMGNAFVAGVEDVTAAYWNPAGLAAISTKGIQIGAQHAEWFAGIAKYDYLGIAFPMPNDRRALGLTAIRFAIDDIPNTLFLYDADGSINYDEIQSFSAADYGFLMTYAHRLRSELGQVYVGGNVKLIHRTIGSFAKAWGFGFDASFLWHLKKVRIGVMVKDVTNTFNAWMFNFNEEEKQILTFTSNVIPTSSLEVTRPQIIIGGAWYHQWKKTGLMAELDLNMTTDGKRNTLISSFPVSIDPTFGIEANYGKFVFLRAGVNNVQKETDFGRDPFWTFQPNLGIGLKLLNLHLDYAYTDVGEQSNKTYSHVVFFGVEFGFWLS